MGNAYAFGPTTFGGAEFTSIGQQQALQVTFPFYSRFRAAYCSTETAVTGITDDDSDTFKAMINMYADRPNISPVDGNWVGYHQLISTEDDFSYFWFIGAPFHITDST